MRKIKFYILLWRNIAGIATIVHWRDLLLFYFPFYWRSSHQLIPLRIRSLGNRKVLIRSGVLIDRDVVKYVFYNQYHLPVRQLQDDAVILDLGSNIGLAAFHLKMKFPGARLIGYEMDEANYKIAVQNCNSLTGCAFHNQAVWSAAGEVQYDRSRDVDSYAVETTSSGAVMNRVMAVTLQDVLQQNGLARVDYLKMDIEGAEESIFLSGDLSWLNKVRELNIECHSPAFLEKALLLIADHGFDTWRDHVHYCMLRAVKKGL